MTATACWCGHHPLQPWNAEYARCPACDTLVLVTPPPAALGRVDDDARDFYGRDYWFAHQHDMGLPSIVERARLDLVDRAPDWLQTLLRFRTPPARTLELGCSHGAFVALLRAAGFDATGLELSPAIAEFARTTFDIPVLVGPIEEQSLTPGSCDVVIAMDVLEHLTDPLATLSAVSRVAASDAVLLLQTPCYPVGASFADLQADAAPFLAMLLPQEHTFLFSERAVSLLLARSGFAHVIFTPAVFAQYDMCVVAGRAALTESTADARAAALLATPAGRLLQALLDTKSDGDASRAAADARLAAAEEDRAARLQVIEQQGAALGVAEARVHELAAEAASLRAHFTASEADREARLELIERQGAELAAVAAAAERVAAFEQRLADCESDRSARLAVIEEQGRELGPLRAAVADLERRLIASEDDRAARLRVIEAQGATIGELAAARDASARTFEDQDRRVAEIESRLTSERTALVALHAYVAALEKSPGVRVLRRLGQIPPPPETP